MGAALSVIARGPDDSRTETAYATLNGVDQGKFELRGLSAGSWDVVVRINRYDAFEAKSIEVRPGEICAPAVLDALVVGADFLVAEVVVRKPDGSPATGAHVNFDPAPASGEVPVSGRPDSVTSMGQEVRADEKGVVRHVIRSGGRVTVRVRHTGFGTVAVPDAAFPLLVTLRPGKRVTVRFSAPLPMPEGVSNYQLSLLPASEAGRGIRGTRSLFAPKTADPGFATVTFNDVSTGAYKLWGAPLYSEVWFARRSANRRPLELGQVFVADGPATDIVVPVTLDAAAIETELRQVLGR
jgi:hypothetical protein